MSVADQSEARRSVFSAAVFDRLTSPLGSTVLSLNSGFTCGGNEQSVTSRNLKTALIIILSLSSPPPHHPNPDCSAAGDGRCGHINGNTATYSTSHKLPFSCASVTQTKWSGVRATFWTCCRVNCNHEAETEPNDGQTHLRCEVVPGRQVFEAKEAVPLAGSASAGVVVHNLTQRHETRSVKRPPTSAFVPRLWCFLSPASVWFSVSLCSTPIQYAPIQRRVTFKTLFIVFIHFTSVCVENSTGHRESGFVKVIQGSFFS